MEDTANYIQLSGTVRSVLYQNELNGYTVIKLDVFDGETITAVGCLPYLSVGEELSLTGQMTVHRTHGEQFKIEYAERHLPTDIDGIFSYLASGAIKGVGPATATLIVSAFGSHSFEVIENEPEKLAQIKGISQKKAMEISELFKKQMGIRRLLEFLSNYEIRPVIAIHLYKVYGDKAMEMLEQNPYIISNEDVGGYFHEADVLGLDMGFSENCPERVSAAIIFELKHNSLNGHTFIPAAALISATCQLIEIDAESCEIALEKLVADGNIIRCEIANRDACYLTDLYNDEVYCADAIKEMAASRVKPPLNGNKLIGEVQSEMSVEYSPLQLHSLKVAMENRVMVLTGGPGTGKTTTVKAIVSLLDKMHLESYLTAPTGRAAKRLSELTGKEAYTVHRLLEAGYSEDLGKTVFKKDEHSLLKCDAVVLDECSMIDISLFASLLRAMPPKCRLILVGDSDQLPSVGPGFVFNDIIRSGAVETIRLTDIFRQNENSRIVDNAHMIIRGDYPVINANRGDSDFFFLRRNQAQSAVSTVIQLCAERLPKNMGIPATDIQVLTPTKKGEAGTYNLNVNLQAALNPPSQNKKEKKFGDFVFREGDRVMQIRNNYDIIWKKVKSVDWPQDGDSFRPYIAFADTNETGLGIFNGDVGTILSIDQDNELLSILFDDRLAYYGFDMLTEIEHAYAITVHKSQGSEYRAVVLLTCSGAEQLLNRCVLYTAVTRAKELLIVVGSDGVFYHMIDNHKVLRRFSGLRARIAD